MTEPSTPLPVVTAPGRGPVDQLAKRGTILLVEDDADTRAALSELLLSDGYQVVAVEDGQKAVDYLTDEERPTAVVLDLWMPVMDGWSVAAEMLIGRVPFVPTVVVTAASAGFAYPVPSRYVLRKPVNPDRLLKLVEEVVRTRGSLGSVE
jgi:CheY-like chemotaxis protein